MKITSLLLGSAAALVAVSGARAADAVVIPEPEAVEYVRVCDAAGTGYFYIPGTETCLKIGGYVRYEVGFSSYNPDYYSDESYVTALTKANLTFSSWTDSEYGAVTTFISLNTYAYDDNGGDDTYLDAAYLTVGGLKMGYFDNFADGTGLNGETDSNGLTTKWNRVQYTGSAGGVSFGVGVDLLDDNYFENNTGYGEGVGVDAMIGFTAGAISAKIVGFYDTDSEGGGVIGMVSAGVGPGTLQARGIWYSEDCTSYSCNWRNYTLEASYAFKATDKLTLTPGVGYVSYYYPTDAWKVGLTADYQLTKTFAIKGSLQYTDSNSDYYVEDNWNSWTGFVRFQASF